MLTCSCYIGLNQKCPFQNGSLLLTGTLEKEATEGTRSLICRWEDKLPSTAPVVSGVAKEGEEGRRQKALYKGQSKVRHEKV